VSFSTAVIWDQYLVPIILLLAPVAIGALVLSMVVSLAVTRSLGRKFWAKLGFLLPFSLLGSVAGLLAGASREPIVGGLLTGLLALVAALVSNFYSNDSQPELKANLPAAIVLLCISAVVSLGLGRVQRAEIEAYDRRFAEWKTQYEQVDVPLILMRERYNACRQMLPPRRRQQCERILTD
jgi:peptidoglycan/LPS O-acetylase OafA/YrhL